MTVLSWKDFLNRPSPFEMPVRLTIGVFDGLHIGHRKLIEGILQGPRSALPLVITFRGNPALVSAPESFPGLILTHGQKLFRMAGLGVQAAVVIDFSEEMSHLSGNAFVSLLKKRLVIEKIVVGYNFRFGKGRSAGTDDLKEMLSDTGTEVQVTEPVLWGDSIVSSSRIRKTIKDAEFPEANAMLAAAYCLDVRGVPKAHRREGSMSIPRSCLSQVLPKTGVYPVRCAGEAAAGPGVLTIADDQLSLAAAGCESISSVIFE
jgi:riboflavin kinase / FMN adenylyltransferase